MKQNIKLKINVTIVIIEMILTDHMDTRRLESVL